MNTTIHREKRGVRPRPIVLTMRDRELFTALADYRVLSTEQARALFYPSVHRARKRLFQLWQHGFLIRAARPIRLGEGSSQRLHALSMRGQKLISDEENRPHFRRANLLAFSEHGERINSLRVCLTMATRLCDDLVLCRWSQGSKLKMLALGSRSTGNVAMQIIPDAMFSLRLGHREFTYFVEIDQGRTDLGRIAQKCAGYLRLWQQKVTQRRFGVRSFRVLYLTTGGKRLDHILEKIRERQQNSTCPDLIAGVTGDAVSLQEPQKLFSMAWRTVAPSGDIVSSCPLPSPSFVRSRQRPEHHSCADQNPDASCKETPGSVDEGSPRLPGSGSG